jgi:hypothetical protein
VVVKQEQEKLAKSTMLWQSVADKNIKAGTTNLWEAKVRLENGMKLPVLEELLRVVVPAVKEEKD